MTMLLPYLKATAEALKWLLIFGLLSYVGGYAFTKGAKAAGWRPTMVFVDGKTMSDIQEERDDVTE